MLLSTYVFICSLEIHVAAYFVVTAYKNLLEMSPSIGKQKGALLINLLDPIINSRLSSTRSKSMRSPLRNDHIYDHLRNVIIRWQSTRTISNTST